MCLCGVSLAYPICSAMYLLLISFPFQRLHFFPRKEFNIDVLKKFIGLQDFTGKNIVGALRCVMSTCFTHMVCVMHVVLCLALCKTHSMLIAVDITMP